MQPYGRQDAPAGPSGPSGTERRWRPAHEAVGTNPHDVGWHHLDPGAVWDARDELLEALERPAWHSRAACRGQGSATWFPTLGSTPKEARRVCATCPVLDECRAWALDQPADLAGVWGGLTERDRRRMRRQRAA